MLRIQDCETMTKEVLYEAMERNGFYLPSPPGSSCIFPKWFLLDAIDNLVWVPRVTELHHRTCPTPPPKTEIWRELKALIAVYYPTMQWP